MKIDFNVNISKLTKGVTSRGFGTILIVDTTGAKDFKLYNDIQSVAPDYETTTKAYKIASRIFGQNPAPQQIAIMGAVDVTLGLNSVADKDFFFIVADDNETATVEKISEWVDTQDKMYFVTTQSLALPGTLESENTVVMYHDNVNAYVAEGLASYLATATVGGVTAKFKTINGVTEAKISSTELDQLHTDGGFSYIRKMGVLQTTGSWATSKEHIDVVIGAFFIKFRMEEEAMLLAVNNPKIPYTNEGIGMLVSVAQDVLKQATNQNIILSNDGVGDYEVNFIPREEVAKNDIASRTYNGITWKATLSGAIESGTINGSLVI